jgi:hypothetical protein
MEEEIKNSILKLEIELQKPDVRKSKDQLDEIISDDLKEIGSKGEFYTKKDALINLPNSPEIKFVMTDFKIDILTPELVQTFFNTEKTLVVTGEKSYSARSSIWKNENGKWKLLFHQGTPRKPSIGE